VAQALDSPPGGGLCTDAWKRCAVSPPTGVFFCKCPSVFLGSVFWSFCFLHLPGSRRSRRMSHAVLPNSAETVRRCCWGNLMVSLLLGVAERPNPREVDSTCPRRQAEFLQLHPIPSKRLRMPASHLWCMNDRRRDKFHAKALDICTIETAGSRTWFTLFSHLFRMLANECI